MGNDRIRKKFDDVDEKISLILGYCQSLELEKKALLLRIEDLEAEIARTRNTELSFSEQEAVIQLKTERLIEKLDSFSNSHKKHKSSAE